MRDVWTDQGLSRAEEALCGGNAATARRLAQGAMARAISRRDAHAEGVSALLLTQALVLDSHLYLAHGVSRRAQARLAQAGDQGRLVQALGLVSYCAGAVGHDDEAIRAAAEGVDLGDHATARRTRAFAFNYLGVASFWARDFRAAVGSLEGAVWMADEPSGQGGGCFQPLVNACFAEVLQLAEGEAHGDERLERLLVRAWSMVKRGQAGELVHGSAGIGMLLLEFASCFLSSRRGRLASADAYYLACLQRSARLRPGNWQQAVVYWARFERARAHGDLDNCFASLLGMEKSARSGEHRQFQALAGRLLAALRARLAADGRRPAVQPGPRPH